MGLGVAQDMGVGEYSGVRNQEKNKQIIITDMLGYIYDNLQNEEVT